MARLRWLLRDQPASPSRAGFSGGPVWDRKLRRVVGMLVHAASDKTARASFFIPTASLVNADSDLQSSDYDEDSHVLAPAMSDYQAYIASEMGQRRQQRQPNKRAVRRYKIDADLLRDFDLKAQLDSFSASFKPKGVLVLTTGGDETIVARYVIPRIRGYMAREWCRTTDDPREIKLKSIDIAGGGQAYTIIEQMTARNYRCARLTDLCLQSGRAADTLFIIWNRDIPASEALTIAASFQQEASRQLSPVVDCKSRLFIVRRGYLAGGPPDGVSYHPAFARFQAQTGYSPSSVPVWSTHR